MIETLKKQWFVVLIAVIFISFIGYTTYDSNKGKLAGKSADGKDVVAAIEGKNTTADDLYEDMYAQYGSNTLYLKFQMSVIEKTIKDSDELKKQADQLAASLKQQAQSSAESQGTTAENLIIQRITQFGFQPDELDRYCMVAVKSQTMRSTYYDARLSELFAPVHKEKNSRMVSHILIKMKDAKKPTKEELAKVKEVEDALKKGTSFSEVAKKYSDDGSAEAGGSLGYMDSDTEYVESFKKVALKLKKGEVSEWVKESNDNYNGWHMIKVDETDMDTIVKNKDVKESIYTAIETKNPDISFQYIWEASKKLDIKFGSDEVKKELMTYMGIKE